MKKFVVLLLSLFTPISAFSQPLKAQKGTRIEKLDIDPTRMAVLKDTVDEVSSADVVKRLKEADKKPGKPITLVIDSPGGYIMAGIDILQAMESLKSPLQCVVDKRAYSMAAIIASYCPKLYVYKFSTIMFHEAATRMEGNETQLDVRNRMFHAMMNDIWVDVAKKLGISLPDFKARIQNEWWLTASEATKIGFATAEVNQLSYAYTPPPRVISFIFGQGLRAIISFWNKTAQFSLDHFVL